jgi:hypothetical protein
MRGRTLLILMSSLACAVVAPAAAVAESGGTDRPWQGSGSGTTTFDVTPGGGLPATSEGTAHFSHLGASTYSSSYNITLTGPSGLGPTFTLAGTQTIVAANGDMLFGTFTGAGQVLGVFGVGQPSEAGTVLTVTGGTGRFVDASGTLTSTFSNEVVSLVGPIATASQAFTAEGTISY